MAQRQFRLDGGFYTDDNSTIHAQLDMDNNKIINIPTPTDNGDVVNKSYVDSYADQAEADAVATAAADATTKADAAEAAAIATASTDATNKADAAEAAAIATASTVATNKADAAEAAAIAAAAADATTKANAAETNANAYTDTAVSNVINGAPGALDTLNELAAALGDDANFASTITNSLSTKASTAYVDTQVATAATTGKAIAMAIVFG